MTSVNCFSYLDLSIRTSIRNLLSFLHLAAKGQAGNPICLFIGSKTVLDQLMTSFFISSAFLRLDNFTVCSRFFCNTLGLLHKLFALLCSFSLRFCCCRIFGRCQTLDCFFWKISLPCFRRRLSRLRSPFLFCPLFQAPLWFLECH